MRIRTLIIGIIISNISFSQDCPIDKWIRENYFFDSQILALREIISDTSHEYQDSVRLPTEITNKYLGIISAVFFQNTDITDSLFDHYSIHAFPNVAYSQI